jgi:hypothetical protein
MTAVADGKLEHGGTFEVNLTADRGSLAPDIFYERLAHDTANEYIQGPQW